MLSNIDVNRVNSILNQFILFPNECRVKKERKQSAIHVNISVFERFYTEYVLK